MSFCRATSQLSKLRLDYGRRVPRKTHDSIRHHCHLSGFSMAIQDSVAVCIWHLGLCVVRHSKIKREVDRADRIEYLGVLVPPISSDRVRHDLF